MGPSKICSKTEMPVSGEAKKPLTVLWGREASKEGRKRGREEGRERVKGGREGEEEEGNMDSVCSIRDYAPCIHSLT